MDSQPGAPEEDKIEPGDDSAAQNDGESVNVDQNFKFGISSQQDISLTDSGAFGIAAGRDMQLTDSGAFSIAAGRDLELKDSGSAILTVGGSAEITGGGALLMLGNDVTANNSTFGILISRKTDLGEGNNVLMDTKQALAFGAVFGIAFGAIFALLSRLLRRR